MLLKKKEFPEEDEIVMCTVTKIHFHSVFVNLDEYGRTGLIHISEVSPGRIRNIRDYVVEGKKVVCKVLRIDEEKGHIDLSLRRVSEGQKRKKANEIKQEQKAEKIIEFVAKNLKINPVQLYNQLSEKILKKYPSIYPAFEESVKNNKLLKELDIADKIAKPLTESIKQRIKEAEVQIGGELTLISYASNGIEIIKEALKKASDVDKSISISYEGGGKYKIMVKAPDYKKAEKMLDAATKNALKFVNKHDSEGSFVRAE
ncbi:translation initiation factor IF-2 subunit alpha [Candidatus Woesearchaeota archaeon]|nr:translation initiation factor IF-2 subunit alpha [Candidatus Woesearchaeota archaeon]